jgi:hypothetical protein
MQSIEFVLLPLTRAQLYSLGHAQSCFTDAVMQLLATDVADVHLPQICCRCVTASSTGLDEGLGFGSVAPDGNKHHNIT